MSWYYGHPAYSGITPYAGHYLYPAYEEEYDPYSDDDNSRRHNRVYNLHPFPTNGRPLGPIHRAAQAEGITLRHIEGCHRHGDCERSQRRQMIRELRRRGAGGQTLTYRQALRVVRGFPAGNPDRTPLLNTEQQASSQQQLGAAPAGAAWGENGWAGQSIQGGTGGGQANGMIGGGGFAGGPRGGMGGPRGGLSGRGAYGRGGGMGGLGRGRGRGMGAIGGYEGAGMEMVHYEGPGGGYGDMVRDDEEYYYGDGY
ncbi:MAG: hypothetical protein Q9188_006123 [Gyalolechia gomerana]